jgi:hypothetical protein
MFDPSPRALQDLACTFRGSHACALRSYTHTLADIPRSINRMQRHEINRTLACPLRNISSRAACTLADISGTVTDIRAGGRLRLRRR